MHLVILTHHCFFWAICHLSRTFPPKELEQEPQNRFFPLPIARPYPLTSYLLPLTHDPPPPVLAGYRLVKSGPCACLISTCVQNLPVAFAVVWRLVCTSYHPFLTSYGVSYFLIPHSLWPTPFRGRALLNCGLFFLQPSFVPFCSLATISYRTTLAFLLWHYLTLACWACYLFFSQWHNVVIWVLYYITCGLFCPIYFVLGILGPRWKLFLYSPSNSICLCLQPVIMEWPLSPSE